MRRRRAFKTHEYLPWVLAILCVAMIATQPGRALASGADDERQSDKPVKKAVISFIGHEVNEERTRVILRADAPIDYRGGRLHGDQVIIDLANVEIALEEPTRVVELGTPEVDRLVIGPELTKDGERLLKVRLTGVDARTHKVTMKGNELLIDLTARENSKDRRKGLPKVIRDDIEIVT